MFEEEEDLKGLFECLGPVQHHLVYIIRPLKEYFVLVEESDCSSSWIWDRLGYDEEGSRDGSLG